MGKPAARLGDMTAHGGTIVLGFPTVLIGGMPAARLGDMHVCPMVTPGVPPIPHVGGPVSLGSAGVLIGGQPAARMGDMLVCVGPPDTIAVGCPTVLIGEVGAGAGGGGGGGGGGGAAAAQSSAATALIDNKESSTKEEHWIEFNFVDSAGLPVSGVPYRLTDTDDRESSGIVRLDGTVRRDALAKDGTCTIVLMGVSGAKWKENAVKVGTTISMEASVDGFEDGEDALIQVFKRDLSGPDVLVAAIDSSVDCGKVKGEWAASAPEQDEGVLVPPEGMDTSPDEPNGYSGPEYYFEVTVGPSNTRSTMLSCQDYVEVEVTDEDGKALAGEEYILYLANGEIRKGALDTSGTLREEDIPPGENKLRFPKLPDFKAEV